MFELHITRLSSTAYYFGQTAMISIAIFIFCGTIGFLSSFLFLRKIYSMIKID